MEPITLAMVALTVVATKATEKVGETLGENVVASAKRWLERLRQHSPEVARRLEASTDSEVIDAEIIAEVTTVSAEHPDVQMAMDATTAAVAMDQSSFQNLTKLADKIGVVNIGPIKSQINNINL